MNKKNNYSVSWKAGQLIVHENSQKGDENVFLYLFKQSSSGQQWFKENNITSKKSHETPDFLFDTNTGKTIGLEIVTISTQEIQWTQVNKRLQTISNKICQYFKNKKGLALSIVIDIYDKRKWEAKTKKEMLDYIYNPGFNEINVSDEKIRNKIIEEISKIDFYSKPLEKLYVQVEKCTFIVTVCEMYKPYISSSVNNSGPSINNPIKYIQKSINKKNDKFKNYIKSCDVCDLLVVSDSTAIVFLEETEKNLFFSKFRNTFLLYTFDNKVIKLLTTNN